MELIFSFISGLGNAIEKTLLALIHDASIFFKDKCYSKSIERVMFILVTKDLTLAEEGAFKVKYTKTESALAINFYFRNAVFLNEDEKEKISYIANIIVNSLMKNKRLANLKIDLTKLVADLLIFFEERP